MGKLFLAVVTGLVGAAIVHIAIVFAIPGQAENDAWSRLARRGDLFAPVRVGEAQAGAPMQDETDESDGFRFVDPAFIVLACRFSVADGPVRLYAEETTPFWTASITARNGDNLYSIGERVALDGRLDLLVGTREQLDLARLEGTADEPQSIPVEFAADEGYLTVRALVASESERPFVERFARSVTCRPGTVEESGRPAS
ncbi:DUF1254 domain-containing protein [Aureimonas pseudogalii]|uniref:Putative membrane protein n=1 Tax=Aureimonas pseudogalii TaxID=1744844 RepID=A0A7W6EEW4_9HYPH|nr:hypothetical protein [Aureimonas pseudogalii]MBB3996584.1 putative membrane protein [Aureimonas pseudogalii]